MLKTKQDKINHLNSLNLLLNPSYNGNLTLLENAILLPVHEYGVTVLPSPVITCMSQLPDLYTKLVINLYTCIRYHRFLWTGLLYPPPPIVIFLCYDDHMFFLRISVCSYFNISNKSPEGGGGGGTKCPVHKHMCTVCQVVRSLYLIVENYHCYMYKRYSKNWLSNMLTLNATYGSS